MKTMRFLCSSALILVALTSTGSLAQPANDVVDTSQVTVGLSYSHSVPVAVPAFYGIEPTIQIRYNVNSPVGLAGPGWTLGGFPTIERQSSSLGLPEYTATDRLFLDGQELVNCPPPGLTPPGVLTGLPPLRLLTVGPAESPLQQRVASPGCLMGGTHATKVESYARIVRSGDVFTYCKDGICATYRPIVCTPKGVFRWGVTQVSDLLGHTTTYEWSNNNSCSGATPVVPSYAYPSRVLYNDGKFTVDIFYENSVNAFPIATGAGSMALSRRVKTVDIKVLTKRNSAHALRYQPQSDVLAMVQPYGTDAVTDASGSVTGGNTALPAQRFTAATPTTTFGAGTLAGTFACPQTGVLTPTDVNADGFTDFVCIDAKTASTDAPSSILIYLNQKNGTFGAPISVQYPVTKKTPSLVDVNCDRYPDLVWVTTTCPQQWKVRVNLGDGTFGAETGWGNLPTDVDVLAAAQFSDVNSDGCSDVIYRATVAPANPVFRIMYGQPNRSDTDPNSVCLGASAALLSLPADAAKDLSGWPLPIQFTDINGDGAGDMVYFRNTTGTTSAELRSVLGTGYAMNGANVSLGVMSEFENLSAMTFGQLVNGRGSDLVYLRAGTSQLMVRPWSNASHSFAAPLPLAAAPTGLKVLSLASGDFDGDGKQDLVATTSTSATLMRPYVYLNTSSEPRLTRIDNGLGGYRKLTYANAATQPNTTGVPTQLIVRSLTDSDGKTESTTRFDYVKGLYDPVDRHLIGFWKVMRTLPCVGTTCPRTTVYFDMDYAGARPIRVDQTDSVSNKFFQSTVLRYALSTGMPFSALMTEKWDFLYDSVTGAARRVATGYSYDFHGRVVTKTDFGEGTSPLRIYLTEYSPMTAATFVSKPSRIALYSGGFVWEPNKLSETKNTYNAKGQITKKEVWVSPSPVDAATPYVTTVYNYDAANRLYQTVEPLNRITTHAFEAELGLYVSRTTNPVGHVVQTAWNPTCGRPSVVTGLNGETSTTTYDVFCRPILRQNVPDGSFEQISYFPWSNTAAAYTRVETPSADGIGNQWVETSIDGAGRTIEVRSKGPSTIISRTQYNAHNQIAVQSRPFYSGASPNNASFAYDVLGRKTQTTYSNGDVERIAYTERSTCTTDEEGHVACDDFDGLGARSAHRELVGTRWLTTRFVYSLRGDLQEISDPLLNVTRFTYNTIGAKVSEVDPVSGTTRLSYNSAGEIASQVNPLNETTSFVYDALGRIRSRTTRSGTAQAVTLTREYDTVTAAGTHNRGLLTRETDPIGATTFDYNAAARAMSVTRHFNEGTGEQVSNGLFVRRQGYVRRYDAGGRLVSMQFANGAGGRLTYDAAGRPSSYLHTADLSQSSPVWTTAAQVTAFTASGQPLSMLQGNGLLTQSVYHPAREFLMQKQTTASDGSHLLTLGYTRNRDGNILNFTHRLGAAAATTTAYQYDARHQLTVAGAQQWTYDDNGRMLTSPLGPYCYPASSPGAQAPSSVWAVGACAIQRYFYDGMGSLVRGPITPNAPDSGSRTLTYDGDHRVASVSSLIGGLANPYQESYDYDFSGIRLRKVVRSQPSVIDSYTHFLSGDVELTTSAAGTKWLQNITLGGQLVAKAHRNGTATAMTFVQVDHLGSVAAETDAAGKLTSSINYLPYGQEAGRQVGPAATAHLGYVGQQQDATGLLYLRARFYDPAISQFTSVDSQRTVRSSVGLHPYAYSLNNPVNRSDVAGEAVEDIAPDDGGDSAEGGADATNGTLGKIADHVGNVLDKLLQVAQAIGRRVTYVRFVDAETGIETGTVGVFDAAFRGGVNFEKSGVKALEAAVAEFKRSPDKYKKFPGSFKVGSQVHDFFVKVPKSADEVAGATELLAARGLRPLTPQEEVAAINNLRKELRLPVPETKLIDGAFVQEVVRGFRTEQLNPAARDLAQATIDRMVGQARAYFRPFGVVVDDCSHNFRFDMNGKNAVWLDPVYAVKMEKK